MTLKELPVGKSGLITAVGGEGILRCRLLDMGLIPNTRVTVQKIAPMGDPMEIRLRSYELTLRMDDAAQRAAASSICRVSTPCAPIRPRRS